MSINTTFTDIVSWFNQYYQSMAGQDVNSALMKLKLEHSKNVAMHTADIAKSEQWSDYDCMLAEILGLLHDIGRFPQLVQYGTFSDSISVNHGIYGAQVLDTEGILDILPKHDAAVIHDGVYYHNARNIPSSIDKRTLLFIKAVRDADKLDIFRVINDAVEHNQIANHPEITLNIDINGPINPHALAELERKENVSYQNVKSLADFGLTQLSWFYDIHFSYTMQYINEHKIISNILKIIPIDEKISAITENILNHIEDYCR